MSISIATLGKFTPPLSSGGGGGYVPYPVESKVPPPLVTADLVRVDSLGDFSKNPYEVKVKSTKLKTLDCKIGVTSVRITQ